MKQDALVQPSVFERHERREEYCRSPLRHRWATFGRAVRCLTTVGASALALAGCSSPDQMEGSSNKILRKERQELGETTEITFEIIGVKVGGVSSATSNTISMTTSWPNPPPLGAPFFQCGSSFSTEACRPDDSGTFHPFPAFPTENGQHIVLSEERHLRRRTVSLEWSCPCQTGHWV